MRSRVIRAMIVHRRHQTSAGQQIDAAQHLDLDIGSLLLVGQYAYPLEETCEFLRRTGHRVGIEGERDRYQAAAREPAPDQKHRQSAAALSLPIQKRHAIRRRVGEGGSDRLQERRMLEHGAQSMSRHEAIPAVGFRLFDRQHADLRVFCVSRRCRWQPRRFAAVRHRIVRFANRCVAHGECPPRLTYDTLS